MTNDLQEARRTAQNFYDMAADAMTTAGADLGPIALATAFEPNAVEMLKREQALHIGSIERQKTKVLELADLLRDAKHVLGKMRERDQVFQVAIGYVEQG